MAVTSEVGCGMEMGGSVGVVAGYSRLTVVVQVQRSQRAKTEGAALDGRDI